MTRRLTAEVIGVDLELGLVVLTLEDGAVQVRINPENDRVRRFKCSACRPSPMPCAHVCAALEVRRALTTLIERTRP